MMSRDLSWLEVTRKWRDLTGNYLEVAVEGQKLAYTAHFITYKAVLQLGGAVTWQEMMSRDLTWPEVTLKWRRLTGSHLKRAVEGWKRAYTVPFTSYTL